MNFKLGFGPMSERSIDVLARYANQKQRPLMFIASRNQVDSDSGYVMTTAQLAQQLAPHRSEYIMLCRDHCGPYFLDHERDLTLSEAVEATKKTIAGDIENKFDLIHIDTSRCGDRGYAVAEELFKFCLDLNPNIKFEFGTEENVGVAAGIEKFKQDVAFASQIPNMEFVVAQTGSLTKEDRQVGTFEFDAVKQLVEYANTAGVKLKEHNADYLTAEQIALRKAAGVHACNIAPQLGVIQTKTVLNLAHLNEIDANEYKISIIASKKWEKWMLDGDAQMMLNVAGHYLFNTDAYKALEQKLMDVCRLDVIIQKELTACLDQYYSNLY